MTSDEIIAYVDGWQWSPACEQEIDNLIADAIHAVEMAAEIETPRQIADYRADRRDMMAIACGRQFDAPGERR